VHVGIADVSRLPPPKGFRRCWRHATRATDIILPERNSGDVEEVPTRRAPDVVLQR
jgi:hypothetical protein